MIAILMFCKAAWNLGQLMQNPKNKNMKLTNWPRVHYVRGVQKGFSGAEGKARCNSSLQCPFCCNCASLPGQCEAWSLWLQMCFRADSILKRRSDVTCLWPYLLLHNQWWVYVAVVDVGIAALLIRLSVTQNWLWNALFCLPKLCLCWILQAVHFNHFHLNMCQTFSPCLVTDCNPAPFFYPLGCSGL